MSRILQPREPRALTADLQRLADIRGPEYMLDCIKFSRPCANGCHGGEWRIFPPAAHGAIRSRWSAWDKSHAAESAIRAARHPQRPQSCPLTPKTGKPKLPLKDA